MERLPRPIVVILLASTLNAMGMGLVIPFTFIYLARVIGFGVQAAGTVLTVSGIISVAAGFVWGSLVDRYGPKWIMVAGLAGQIIGLGGFALSSSRESTVFWWLITSLFQASNYTSQSTYLAIVTDKKEASACAFGLKFMFANLAGGAGGLIASWLISDNAGKSYHLLYWLDACGFAVFMVLAVCFLPKIEVHSSMESDKERNSGSYREAARLSSFRLIIILCLALTLMGQAALEYGPPILVTVTAAVPAYGLAWIFSVNAVSITVLQPLLLARVRIISRALALRGAALAWAAANAVMCVLATFVIRGSLALSLLLATGVLIAIGEVLLAPVLGPVVNDLAPGHMRGRFNVAASVSFGLAYTVAPVLLASTLGSHQSWAYAIFLTVATGTIFMISSALNLDPRATRQAVAESVDSPKG